MALFATLARDCRFALRQFARTPVVSAVALASLALGIGANVAIFSLINALLLKALPVHEPDRLVQIRLADPNVSGPRGLTTSFTNPQWEYLRDHADFVTGVAAMSGARFNLNAGGETRPVQGLYVSGRFLDTLGVVPVLGRGFTSDDDRRGGEGVAVVSYGFWQREFGGDPGAVGRVVTLDGHPFTVLGVTPPEFFGARVGTAFDVMIPIASEPTIRGNSESWLDRRSTWWLTLLARLAPGQTQAQAQSQFEALHPALREATMPQDWRPQDQAQYINDPFDLVPAATGVSSLRDRYSRPLFVLLAIVGLVLAIACANMANLLLAQSLARRRELAIRLSLGAGRLQLARQLIAESLLLSLAGAGAGLVLAAWGSRALVAMLSTRSNLVALDLSMDWRVFGFTALVGVATGLVFGVVPALRGTRVAPADAMRDHGRGVVSGGSRPGIGHALVAIQVALSFVLVFGSSLFVRTLVGLTSQNLGFDAGHVLIASIDLRRTGLADDGPRVRAFAAVRDALAGVPGVEAAAGSFVTPVSGSTWNYRITVPGFDAPERERVALFNAVTQDYFRSMGTPILAGRDISPADTAGRPMVMMVNEAFAKKFFAGDNPIGRQVTIDRFTADRRDATFEIIGLVADAKYQTLREEPQPTMYASLAQQEQVGTSARMVLRTMGPPMAARAAAVAAIARVDPEITADLKSLDEDLGASVLQERLVAYLSAAFGGLALLLAALGLYGVMSYAVSRRRNEIGIRMALGAEPGRVMQLILRHVAAITGAGLVAGIAASVGAGRFVNALLFNLVATDSTMILLAALTLAATAAVAGYLPARRAARIDPMRALREE